MRPAPVPASTLQTILQFIKGLDPSDPQATSISQRELATGTYMLSLFQKQGPELHSQPIQHKAEAFFKAQQNNHVPEGKKYSITEALTYLRKANPVLAQQHTPNFGADRVQEAIDLPPTNILPSPEHWEDTSIYFLMLDRFNDGDPSNNGAGSVEYDLNKPRASHGGDFEGVIQKLDYIASLGHNAIWLGPVCLQYGPTAYHGYHTLDFFRVDPRLGSMADLRRLVDEAHARGIRIMLDVVWQHTAPVHKYDDGDVQYDPNGHSFHYKPDAPALGPLDLMEALPFYGHGPINDWNHPTQRYDGDFFDLPAIDMSQPVVHQTMANMLLYFIKMCGIDAARIDTAGHFKPEHHRPILDLIHAGLNKLGLDDFFMMPEQYHYDWNAQYPYVRSEQTPDAPYASTINFPFMGGIRHALTHADSKSLQGVLQGQQKLEAPNRVGNCIDNHDLTRFAHTFTPEQAEPATQAALSLMFSWPGLPIVYYGTEQGFDGGHDPHNREDLTGHFNPEHRLYKHIQRLNRWRNEHIALRRGQAQELWSEHGPLYAFARTHEKETALSVANLSDKIRDHQRIPVQAAGLQTGDTLTDLYTGDKFVVQHGSIRIPIQPEAENADADKADTIDGDSTVDGGDDQETADPNAEQPSANPDYEVITGPYLDLPDLEPYQCLMLIADT